MTYLKGCGRYVAALGDAEVSDYLVAGPAFSWVTDREVSMNAHAWPREENERPGGDDRDNWSPRIAYSRHRSSRRYDGR